jgi:putative spermidine/putrescine transport system ATP-binding protein
VRFCRPEDVLLADDTRYAQRGVVVGSMFLGASQRLLIDIGLDNPIQVDRHAREIWQAGQRISWSLTSHAALEFSC